MHYKCSFCRKHLCKTIDHSERIEEVEVLLIYKAPAASKRPQHRLVWKLWLVPVGFKRLYSNCWSNHMSRLYLFCPPVVKSEGHINFGLAVVADQWLFKTFVFLPLCLSTWIMWLFYSFHLNYWALNSTCTACNAKKLFHWFFFK